MEDDFEDIELPTVDETKGGQVSAGFNGEWRNTESKPLKHINCIIDKNIVKRVRDFEYCVNRKLGGSNEFGGYVKWYWDNKGNIIVDDFMIPKQVVGGATVDFRSEATPGYTGVFHKHPTGCKSFSGTDDNYINANHDLSILFEGGTFITGIVNIDLPGGKRLQIVPRIVILDHETRNEVDVGMIEGRPVEQQGFFRGIHRGFQGVNRAPAASLPGFTQGTGSLEQFLENDDDGEGDDDEFLDL